MSCRCAAPEPHPRWAGECVRCGLRFGERWLSSDATIAEFFDRLATVFPGGVPDHFREFRAHCERRERLGRDRYRVSYLSNDNPVEATEEAADGALYAFFDTLVARRAGEEERADLALTAAYHFAQAHHTLRLLAAKRRGSP